MPRAIELCAIAVLLIAGMLSLRVVVLGDSANSRLATAFSLVTHASWYIDDDGRDVPNPFEAGTVDKIERDGRMLSTKPPVLPLLMAAEYSVIRNVFGLELNVREEARTIVRVMVLTLMLLPLCVGLLFFSSTLTLLGAGPWMRVYLVAALALATSIPGFAGHINNHTPAAALLCVAAWCAVSVLLKGSPTPWHLIGFGLAGGLVFTLDLPETIYVAALGLPLLWRFPRQAVLWGGAGLALPLGVHFVAMYISTGSLMPVQMHEDWYLYESAYWRNPGGVDALNEAKGAYLFHMMLGRYGTFILFPVLGLGLVGAGMALARSQKNLAAWAAIGGLAAFVVLTAYYVLKTNNYGGVAYGFRWHLASAPVLLMMSLPLLERVRKRWMIIPLLLVFGISAYSAWECYQNPWSKDTEWTARLVYGPSVKGE